MPRAAELRTLVGALPARMAQNGKEAGSGASFSDIVQHLQTYHNIYVSKEYLAKYGASVTEAWQAGVKSLGQGEKGNKPEPTGPGTKKQLKPRVRKKGLPTAQPVKNTPSWKVLRTIVARLPDEVAVQGKKLDPNLAGAQIDKLLMEHKGYSPEQLGILADRKPTQEMKERREALEEVWQEAAGKHNAKVEQNEQLRQQRRQEAREKRRSDLQYVLTSQDGMRQAEAVAKAPDARALRLAIDAVKTNDLFPEGLLVGVRQVGDYSVRLGRDMERIETLSARLKEGTASEEDSRQLKRLLNSHREKLAVAQTWLGDRIGSVLDNGVSTGTYLDNMMIRTMPAVKGLSARLADQHMRLADITADCIDDLPADDGSGPVDENGLTATDYRSYALLQADAMVRGLTWEMERNPGANQIYQPIIDDLTTHRDRLRSVALPGNSPEPLAALADFPLEGDRARRAKTVETLNRDWGTIGRAVLPLEVTGLDQRELMEAYIRNRLEAKEAPVPDMKRLYQQGYTEAVDNGSWEAVVRPVTLETATGETKLTSRIVPAGVNLEQDHGPDAVTWVRQGTSSTPPSPAVSSRSSSSGAGSASPSPDESLQFVPPRRDAQIAPENDPRNGGVARFFETPYKTAGVGAQSRLQVDHVPNLAQTQLEDASGEVIFQGLRHGVMDSYRLNGEALRTMPADEAAHLIEKTLWPWPDSKDGFDTPQQAAAHLQDMSRGRLDELASTARTKASDAMARELAVAAVAAQPELLARAVAGETVDLTLNSISLLTPDMVRRGSSAERSMLKHQTDALQALAKSDQPVELKITDSLGQPRTIKVNLDIRTLNFGVNKGAVEKIAGFRTDNPILRDVAGWGFAMQLNDPALTELVGPASERGPGGAVEQYLTKNTQPVSLAALNKEEARINNELGDVVRHREVAERSAVPPHLEQLEKEYKNNEIAYQAAKEDYVRFSEGEPAKKFYSRVAEDIEEGLGTVLDDDAARKFEAAASITLGKVVDDYRGEPADDVAAEIDSIESQFPNGDAKKADFKTTEGQNLYIRHQALQWYRDEIIARRDVFEPVQSAFLESEKALEEGYEIAKSPENMGMREEWMLQDLERIDTREGELRADLARVTQMKEKEIKLEQVIELTNQIKTMWRDGSFRQAGNEPYKMVSRLALLSHLIGDATAFNCKSGKDRTGQLDAEVKLLAARLHTTGELPPVDAPPTDESRNQRSEFSLNTGNLEMQRLNTGLPGYKLSGFKPLARQMQEKDLARIYGGSRMVQS